jgi:hypothetical protein
VFPFKFDVPATVMLLMRMREMPKSEIMGIPLQQTRMLSCVDLKGVNV